MLPYSYLVLGVDPVSNESNIPLTTKITVNFAKPINMDTLNSNTIRLRKVNGDFIEYTSQYTPLDRKYIMTPSNQLEPGVQYQTIVLGGQNGVLAVDGSYLPATKTYEFVTVAREGVRSLSNLSLKQDYYFINAKWDMPSGLLEGEEVYFNVRLSELSNPDASDIWPLNPIEGKTTSCEFTIPYKADAEKNYYVHVQAVTKEKTTDWITAQIYIEPLSQPITTEPSNSSGSTSDSSSGSESSPPVVIGDPGQLMVIDHSPVLNEISTPSEIVVVFNDEIDPTLFGGVIDTPTDTNEEPAKEEPSTTPIDDQSPIDENNNTGTSPEDDTVVTLADESDSNTETLDETTNQTPDDVTTEEPVTEVGQDETDSEKQAEANPLFYIVEAPYKESLSLIDLRGKYNVKNALKGFVNIDPDSPSLLVFSPEKGANDFVAGKDYTVILSKKLKGIKTMEMGVDFLFGFSARPEHFHGDINYIKEVLTSLNIEPTDSFLQSLMKKYSQYACDIWYESSTYDESLHQDGDAPYYIHQYVNTQVLVDSLLHGGLHSSVGGDETVTLGSLTIEKSGGDGGNSSALDIISELQSQLKEWEDLVHGYHNRGYASPGNVVKGENAATLPSYITRTTMNTDFDA